jgi:predicted DNA-binding protein (MmcQ/YjbR family)
VVTDPREDLRRRLAALPGAAEEYPFKLAVRVFKVGGKMFAVTGLDDDPACVTLKGDPEDNEADRAEYPAVRPGYHMNKRHWNTVTLDGSVPDEVLTEMIQASYAIVVSGLTRAARASLLERSKENNA